MLLAQAMCEVGHRFDGINFPTPEGNCPRCICPEVEEDLNRYYQLTLLAVEGTRRGPIHPSLLTHA